MDQTPPHPTALDRAWAALEAAGVAVALLRGTGGADEAEIDLLVAPADARRLANALAEVGFARLPAIGHGAHRFFRAYDPGVDRWWTLDVVDRFGFSRDGALRLALDVHSVLDRRDRSARPARLAGDDAFWALLLHDLVDRDDAPDAHRAELADLAPAARADGALGAALDAAAGPGSATRLLAPAAVGDLDAARDVAKRLAAGWRRRDLRRWLQDRLTGSLARRLRKPHTAIARRGIDVAVLGPDGAGKSSVVAGLAAGPMPVRTAYLGLYAASARGGRLAALRRVGRLWRGWLGGLWHRLRGRIVVYDRHALDAAIGRGGSVRRRVRRGLLARAIPGPALIVVLDAPGAVLHARSGEHDPAALETQRAAYRALAERRASARLVDATADPDAVRRTVTDLVWRRWTGTER